ncbi:MAG: 6-carboxytetrahydropterin synthase QueD [Candidatus Anammoxibacter sp.]
MFEIIVEDTFSAAHNLRDYEGECENVHGHNWKVQIVLESEKINNQGLVIDFKDVKKIMHGLIDNFDHKYLNDLDDFSKNNPTTENISKLLFYALKDKMPKDISVKKVTTWESEGFGASYY